MKESDKIIKDHYATSKNMKQNKTHIFIATEPTISFENPQALQEYKRRQAQKILNMSFAQYSQGSWQ